MNRLFGRSQNYARQRPSQAVWSLIILGCATFWLSCLAIALS